MDIKVITIYIPLLNHEITGGLAGLFKYVCALLKIEVTKYIYFLLRIL